jgi:hypothetical protein
MFGAVVSAAGGIAKGVLGAVQAAKAKKAIANYKRQDLANAYEKMSVSTLGADLAREELARVSASSVDALQQSGVRGVVGGIGKVVEANSKQSRAIGVDLDKQDQAIQKLEADDDVRIRTLQEEREKADLAGLGQQLAVGQQNLFSGISDVAQSGSSIASSAKQNAGTGKGISGFLGFE